MSVVEAGRLVFPAGAEGARRYAERSLVSLHGRLARLKAIARGVKLTAEPRALDSEDLLRVAMDAAGEQTSEWLLLRDYGEIRRHRNVVFLFAPGDDHPRHIVKIRRSQCEGASLRSEADVLQHVAALGDRDLVKSVPAVHDLVTCGEWEVLVLAPLPGRPLLILMQRSTRPRTRFAQQLISSGSWLGRLHAATRSGQQTVVHGDFWPRNILVSPEGVITGVVDWERSATSGEPWPDVFNLPLLFATSGPRWRRHDYLADFRRAFTGSSRLSQAIGGYFRAYSSAAGVPLHTLSAEFDRYLGSRQAPAGKEDNGWPPHYPWPAMLAATRAAARSVFSG